MRLTQEQRNQLQAIVEIELKTQELLAKARLKAAEALEEQLEDETPPTREQLQFIRLATQFLARPFRPLELVIKSTMRAQKRNEDPFAQSNLAMLMQQAAG